MIPRGYQWEAVVSIWKYLEQTKPGSNPLVAMPTGTGKAGVIAFFIRSVVELYPSQKILVLTHVKELIEQDYRTLMRVWPVAPAGINSAGLGRRDVHQPIIFAGIASIQKEPHVFGRVDLVLIDEADLVSPNDKTMYRKFLNELITVNPYLRVIGLTATPWRIGQGKLTEGDDRLFTDICIDMTTMEKFNWFIDQGYLCPLIPKQTDLQIDVSGVRTQNGDFIQSELQNAVDRDDITERALREALEIAGDRYAWLIFTSGVEHAVHVSEMLNTLGVSCGVVHGGNKKYKMTDEQRDQTIADFKAGKLRAIANNNVLTTGFDYPNIDLIINLRPSKSARLWVQMLGRGTRPVYAEGFDLNSQEGRLQAIAASTKQNTLVLDFGGNTKRLGPINDPYLPKLKKKGPPGEAPVKECPNVLDNGKGCKTINHATARFCICCNYEFKFDVKIKQSASTDEIIKSDLPITEEFKVDHITYNVHYKDGAPPMLKATYYCGYRMFIDYVCVQHSGFARKKAEQWWKQRFNNQLPPNTVEEAALLCNGLTTATSIRVWTNKKYPEILAYCFDGTHFGKEEKSQIEVTVQNELVKQTFKSPSINDKPIDDSFLDDDIPF